MLSDKEVEKILEDPHMQVLHPKEGDVVQVLIEQPLPVQQADRIHEKIREFFPKNKVIVLTHGIKLETTSKEEAKRILEKIIK